MPWCTNAVLDKYTVVEEQAQLGVDLEGDRQRYTVSEGGIVVIGKSTTVPRSRSVRGRFVPMTVVGMEVGSPTPSPSPSTVSEESLKPIRNSGRTLLDTSRDIPDTVIYLVTAIAVLAMAWFPAQVPGADADWTWSSVSYRRLDPWAQTMRAWFRAAPVTFIYVATWTVTTIIFRGPPRRLPTSSTASTALISRIAGSPVRVLFASAFIVAEYGMGFSVYVVVYLLITRAAGTADRVGAGDRGRMASHGLGSLLTVAVESVLLH